MLSALDACEKAGNPQTDQADAPKKEKQEIKEEKEDTNEKDETFWYELPFDCIEAKEDEVERVRGKKWSGLRYETIF